METSPELELKTKDDKEEEYYYEIIKTIDNIYGKLFIVLCDLNKLGQKKKFLLKKFIIKR